MTRAHRLSAASILSLLAALSAPSIAEATSCSPECDCPVYFAGEGGRDEVLFPGDGETVPTNARLFVARPALDTAAITLVESATGTPVAFRIEPSAWSASHVWVVPEEPLRAGVEHTFRVGEEESDVSTFAVEGVDGRAPDLVQLHATHRVPCNEAIYVVLTAVASDRGDEQLLFHFTVEGGDLAAPIHFFRRTTNSWGEVQLMLGRALDDEGCFEDTLPEAEDGAEYDVRLEVYDPAGQLGTETPSLRTTTAHKETSPPEDATCVAGCCVLSVGARPHAEPSGLFVALAAIVAWRWRRRRA